MPEALTIFWLTLTLVGGAAPAGLSVFGGHTLADCQVNGRTLADRHNRLPRQDAGRWVFECHEARVTRGQ